MLVHPRIDGGIPLDSAVESQQFRRLHEFQSISNRDLIRPPLSAIGAFSGPYAKIETEC
jgi:hypothetical protein